MGGGQAREGGLEIRLLCALCPACCAGRAGRPLGIKDPGAGCRRSATRPSSLLRCELRFLPKARVLVACAVAQGSDTVRLCLPGKLAQGAASQQPVTAFTVQSRPRRLQVMSFPSWEATAAQLSWLLSPPPLPRPGPSVSHRPKGGGGGLARCCLRTVPVQGRAGPVPWGWWPGKPPGQGEALG